MSQTPSSTSDEGNDRNSISVARLGMFGAIAVAVIGAAVPITQAIISHNDKSDDPPKPVNTGVSSPVTPVPSCSRASIAFSEPAASAASIVPGTTVHFAGTVDCLPQGHDFWLVSRISASSKIYIATTDPVPVDDGDWQADVYRLGDSSDAGGSRTFFGVDADQKCSAAILAVKDKSPRALSSLPSVCVRLKPEMVVKFRS
jgi:hypothetical protein